MARDILYNALIKEYEAEIADANAKVTIMLTDPRIIPEHIDITGEVDKLLQIMAEAEDKLSIMRKYYVKNKADKEIL